ncbi:MAG: hypothetical protein OIF56_05380 [Cohaesibacter sp.]|nr:hypothetical protein [Cohaesibacter sp.]
MKKAISVALMIGLAGCATAPSKVKPTYVSSYQYNSYSCAEIRQELTTVSARVQQITGQQQSAATTDAVVMGVGLILFWPALFLLAATDDQKDELGRLKGEYEALHSAAKAKKCRL